MIRMIDGDKRRLREHVETFSLGYVQGALDAAGGDRDNHMSYDPYPTRATLADIAENYCKNSESIREVSYSEVAGVIRRVVETVDNENRKDQG